MTPMAAPAKRATPSKGKPPSKPAAASLGPSLRFYHSAELRKETLALLGKIEKARDASVHRDALADIVVELTNSGLEAYFLKPLKLANAGFIVEQSAGLGMKGVQQIMATVIRRVIGGMGSPQLLSVCGSIRQFML